MNLIHHLMVTDYGVKAIVDRFLQKVYHLKYYNTNGIPLHGNRGSSEENKRYRPHSG